MSRGLDTQGYPILRKVFKHEQDKNRNQVVGGGGLYIHIYVYLIYMIENSITHNLMSRGLDTQGYTILRNVFKHEQDKNRKKPGRG